MSCTLSNDDVGRIVVSAISVLINLLFLLAVVMTTKKGGYSTILKLLIAQSIGDIFCAGFYVPIRVVSFLRDCHDQDKLHALRETQRITAGLFGRNLTLLSPVFIAAWRYMTVARLVKAWQKGIILASVIFTTLLYVIYACLIISRYDMDKYEDPTSKASSIVWFIFLFSASLLIVIYNTRMLLFVRKLRSQINPSINPAEPRKIRSTNTLTITIIVINVFVLLTTIPYNAMLMVYLLVSQFQLDLDVNWTVFMDALPAIKIIFALNTFINSLMYLIFTPRLREFYLPCLKKKQGETVVVQDNGTYDELDEEL